MRKRAGRYRGRHVKTGGKPGGRRKSAAVKENRAVGRLVICGGMFVLLVLIKILFPQTAGHIRTSVGELLIRNADFREAFAAVGRAVSGEEDVNKSLQDAYVAVFNPGKRGEGDAAEVFAAHTAVTLEPANLYDRFVPPAFSEPELTREITLSLTETVEEPVVQTLSQVYASAGLPENATMAQRNLGFAYQSPVVGKLSSPYGWREHPVEGEDKFHYGVDLAAGKGTDICAFADGTVFATGESSTLGKYVMLRHADRYMTLYAHCDRVIKTGGNVKMGEKIAEVGETGMATGPHLHFELQEGDLYLNPLYYVEIRTS